MNQFEDEQVVCADCGVSFVFSGGEAAFYAQRNLAFPPKRCKECRAARKNGARPGGDAAPRQSAPPQGYDQGGGGYRRDARPALTNDRPRSPRYTGAVDEYRSPMQDNVYFAPPAWGRQAPNPGYAQQQPAPQRRSNGWAPPEGEYRAPAFRGDEPPRGYGGGQDQAPRGYGGGQDQAPRGYGGQQDAQYDNRRMAPSAGYDQGARPRPHGSLFDITCKTCGAQAQVPFKPIEGRDVFCQACYRARKPIRNAID